MRPASKNPVARALAAKRPAKVRPRKGRRAYARKPRNQEDKHD